MKVFPRRTPYALIEENVKMVMRALLPSCASQVFPGPSEPVGQRIVWISLYSGFVDEGAASISAFCRGIGTSEDENGDAPGEYGTLGLLVLLTDVVFPAKDVTNEPAKNKLDEEVFEVIEKTWAFSPDSPLKGGADHEFDFVFQMATDEPGDEKCPPTQRLLLGTSQYRAVTGPLGPFEPTEEKVPEEGEYDAT